MPLFQCLRYLKRGRRLPSKPVAIAKFWYGLQLSPQIVDGFNQLAACPFAKHENVVIGPRIGYVKLNLLSPASNAHSTRVATLGEFPIVLCILFVMHPDVFALHEFPISKIFMQLPLSRPFQPRGPTNR